MIKNSVAGFALLFASGMVLAQMTPVGTWHTIDDETKEVKSEVQIVDNGGVLSGKVTKLLRKGAKQDAVCDKCTDDRKDKPVLGLEIIRGAKKAEGKDVWEDGKILDPEKRQDLHAAPDPGRRRQEARRARLGVWHRPHADLGSRPVIPLSPSWPRACPASCAIARIFKRVNSCPVSKSNKSPCSVPA